MTKHVVTTRNAPAPIGPYSQAVRAGNFLFISGQVPINPENQEVVAGSITKEAEQVMLNLQAILEESGMNFTNVVKSTIFLTDMLYFTEVNEVYSKYFNTDFPARETVAVAGLPKNVNVEISMIAFAQ